MDAERRISRIWSRYKRSGSSLLRNALLEQYLPYVRKLAVRTRSRLPAQVQVDDLVSAGVFGLAEAIEAYQLDRQVRFTTFSARRITGAMLDELRAMDWVPRKMRTAARQLDTATQEFQHARGRLPSDEEAAMRLQLPIAQYARLEKAARQASLLSLDQGRPSNATGAAVETRQLRDASAPDPVGESQQRSLRELVARGLSRSERLIVVLYYYEQMNMKEVGRTLDISESRVCQLHQSILQRLRATLGKRTDLLEVDAA